MTELPHITAYLRRLRRMSARPTLLITGGWLALVLLVMLQPGLLHGFEGCIISLGIVIAGKFAIYWVIAETMAGLAREGKRSTPAWYLSPLPNSTALLGVLSTAMIAVIPPLAGLISFTPLHTAVWMDLDFNYAELGGICAQHGCQPSMLLLSIVQFILHLPLFALFSACVQLALRRMAYASLLPVMLSTSAVLAGFWQVSLFEEPNLTGGYMIDWVWTVNCVVLGLLLLALLLFLMKWCAECEALNPLYGVLTIWVIVLPSCIGITALSAVLSSTFSGSYYYQPNHFSFIYNGLLAPVFRISHPSCLT